MVRQRFFTAIQRLTVLQRAGFHCQLCGIELQPNNFHCDHKKAWSLGGATEVYNAQALCADCNLTKSNTEVSE